MGSDEVMQLIKALSSGPRGISKAFYLIQVWYRQALVLSTVDNSFHLQHLPATTDTLSGKHVAISNIF